MAINEKTMSIKAPQADLNQGSQRAGQVTGKRDVASGPAEGSGTAPASADTVTLTAAAAQLLKLEERLAQLPDMDSQRIAEVKAAIAEGSYRVDAGDIVDRLLTIEQDIP